MLLVSRSPSSSVGQARLVAALAVHVFDKAAGLLEMRGFQSCRGGVLRVRVVRGLSALVNSGDDAGNDNSSATLEARTRLVELEWNKEEDLDRLNIASASKDRIVKQLSRTPRAKMWAEG